MTSQSFQLFLSSVHKIQILGFPDDDTTRKQQETECLERWQLKSTNSYRVLHAWPGVVGGLPPAKYLLPDNPNFAGSGCGRGWVQPDCQPRFACPEWVVGPAATTWTGAADRPLGWGTSLDQPVGALPIKRAVGYSWSSPFVFALTAKRKQVAPSAHSAACGWGQALTFGNIIAPIAGRSLCLVNIYQLLIFLPCLLHDAFVLDASQPDTRTRHLLAPFASSRNYREREGLRFHRLYGQQLRGRWTLCLLSVSRHLTTPPAATVVLNTAYRNSPVAVLRVVMVRVNRNEKVERSRKH